MQHNPSFTPNHVSQESFSKTQQLSADRDVEELMQQSSDVASNQQWLFNRDIYFPNSQKLPPGLTMSNTGSTYPSQMQQNKHVIMSSYNNTGNGQPFNNFPDSDICRPQSEMNTPCFESFYEDNYNQGNGMPIGNEQSVPEDINQLVSSFQSFMAHGHDGIYYGDLTNMQKQMVGVHHEDNMAEQWKITSPTMSRQSSPGIQIPKQLGELGTVQRERTRGVSKQTFKHDGFQELPDFYPQSAEYFQQPKQLSALLNLPNHYHNKIMHRENINVSTNQYSKHHIQHSRLQNKTKPQVQKEKKKMQASGFQREGFTRRPQFNLPMRGGDGQLPSQNPYFEFQENMQSKRFDRENSMGSAGNVPQFMPFMYPINDPRRYSGMPINSNFSTRSTLPYASSFPGMDVGDVMSPNEPAAFKSYHSGMRTHRGENTYYGMASAMTTSMFMNHGGPVIQLYFHLDQCYEQWRCLEKERKRVFILTEAFLEKRTPGVTNSNLPKTPPNPSGVDHLLVNQTREQAKVANLLERMECLCGTPLPKNIHAALNRHHMAIWITQSRFKEDIVNMTKHQWQRLHFMKDRDAMLVSMALKDLATTTRKLRTALWCALQMTLPNPIKTQDHHTNKEDTNKERCPSPFEGYSFRL
uniref:Uncharacterized protein n=1 Tax=Amphilophus citrinellus TaxID=61819 RepID=A0A3Q0RVS7_AMPCI